MKQTLLAILIVALSGCGLFKFQPPPATPQPEDDGAAKLEQVLGSTVSLAAEIEGKKVHFCSGVAVEGAILTADHCVSVFFTEKYKDVKWFVLYRGEYFHGVVVTRWTEKDMAVIDAVGARIRDTVSVSPWEPSYGMRVVWTGYPLGFTKVHLFAGYVAAPGSEYNDYTFDVDGQFIGGNSGGPLFDENGRLLGIVVSTAVGMGAEIPEIMPVGQAVLPENIRKILE